MPHEHSARRRGPIHRARILTSSNMCFHITKYTYPIRQIPAFISSNTYLTIIKHTHSFHRTRISPLHFVSVYVYAGTINRSLQLLTDCDNAADGLNNAANKLQYTHIHPRNTILLHRKNHTFAPQKPYFRTANTILLHRKNHTFTPQKTTFYTAKTYRRQIGRVAKTFC